MQHIRNFCIIAHIDHGKSTLADRLLEFTKTVTHREMQAQLLDDMDLERERGITIKSHAIQMNFPFNGNQYVLNLIDTPGHVDFSYEVSRSIAACEGALLIVDAAQGIQAQTISNLYLALENDLTIIPILNKIDLPGAMIEEVSDQIVDLLGCNRDEIIHASGKTGFGVDNILKAIIEDEIKAGDVGYIISGIKEAREVKVGDTLTHFDNPCKDFIDGFEDVKPMVFAGIYPVDTEDFEELREAMYKLQLNDASLTFEPESSAALGFGFRCGFLGMLHMEIIQERLEREFNMTVITTVPNVSYHAYLTSGEMIVVNNPSDLPDPGKTNYVEEPFINAQIITKADYIGAIMSLCLGKRGILKNQTYLTTDRIEMNFDMPLAEVVFDFFDRLKTVSRGYASFDYHPIGYVESDMVKLDILLNKDIVDALSAVIHRDRAYDWGKRICEKLKELIPRHQFEIPIQASIGAKVISRETLKALRKDVTAKCYGGDISRKRKLLEKQKEGKKRMRQVGSVEIPQSAFMALLKLD
ncbi:MAG: elongation factor 4 [Bacteroidetes bacterium]|nr:elongation factor 4 [Bacteroidota bacterium]